MSPAREGRCCHKPAWTPSCPYPCWPLSTEDALCHPGPCPCLSNEGFGAYSAPTGAHRGAWPLPWESGPSCSALPPLWTPGHKALTGQQPRSSGALSRDPPQDSQENRTGTSGPSCLPASPGPLATGGSVKDTFPVWQPLERCHYVPREPPPQRVEKAAPPIGPVITLNLHPPAFPPKSHPHTMPTQDRTRAASQTPSLAHVLEFWGC